MISLCCLQNGDLFYDSFGHLCTVERIDKKKGLCHYHYTNDVGFYVYRFIPFTTIVNEFIEHEQLTLF